MRHVPVATFKDHASEYIAAAERGEEIIVTRHGKPAVRLSSASEGDGTESRARLALERLATMRAKLRAESRTSSLADLIAWKNEGRP